MGKHDKERAADVEESGNGQVVVMERAEVAPTPTTEIIPSEYRALAKPTHQIQRIIQGTIGAGIGTFDLDRIKVPSAESSVWSVPTLKGNVPQPYVDAIILDSTLARSYWKEPVGTGAPVPPSCSSQDSIMGIGEPGGPCRKCPLSQFGTALKPNGKPGRGQACKQGRMMLLLRPQDIVPILLIIPPGSLKETNKFLLRLTQSDSAQYAVMRFGLKQTSNADGTKYNQVSMEVVRPLNTAELERMLAIKDMFKDFLGSHTIEAEDVVTDAE